MEYTALNFRFMAFHRWCPKVVATNRKKDRNTMINHLLTLQEAQSEYYTDDTIKGLILVINHSQFSFDFVINACMHGVSKTKSLLRFLFQIMLLAGTRSTVTTPLEWAVCRCDNESKRRFGD